MSISEKVRQALSWFHFQNDKIANVPQQAKKCMSFCEVVEVGPLSGSWSVSLVLLRMLKCHLEFLPLLGFCPLHRHAYGVHSHQHTRT